MKKSDMGSGIQRGATCTAISGNKKKKTSKKQKHEFFFFDEDTSFRMEFLLQFEKSRNSLMVDLHLLGNNFTSSMVSIGNVRRMLKCLWLQWNSLYDSNSRSEAHFSSREMDLSTSWPFERKKGTANENGIFDYTMGHRIDFSFVGLLTFLLSLVGSISLRVPF